MASRRWGAGTGVRMMDEHDETLELRVERVRADRARALLAMQAVANVTGVPAAAMQSRCRVNDEVRRARSFAWYLSHTEYGWPMYRVGAAFDRDRTTVAKACHDVEDMRDDPALDGLLERVGRGLAEITGVTEAA
ncbi:helix-turn-helix domain-containing protein [Brevundimonas sp.]|uniref:helix-turn-helix domain-containing protein n=1 Tax=Brevundimonas sp. TaxID=1871086 RepID=UPI0039191B0E